MNDKFLNLLKEGRPKKDEITLSRSSKERKAINKVCYEVSKKRWPHPKDAFDKVQEACTKNGLIIVQEDGTKWSGMWSTGKPGKENSTTFDLAMMVHDGNGEFEDDTMHNTIGNTVLAFQWYKASDEGNVEVNCYLS